MITIRHASEQDIADWSLLRHALWGGKVDDLKREAADLLGHPDQVAFLATTTESGAIGFIEGALRSSDAHVYGFIEGWYVTEGKRGGGTGGALIERLEEWFLHHQVSHILSDTEPERYPGSAGAHEASGYKRVSEMVIFMKESP